MATTKVKRIGKYEVLDVLGKGGMGVVYKATDPSIGRLVAIKMITSGYAEDPDFLRRFYREAQSTGKLQHHNIVIVHDLGDQDGTPFLVMEFLEGESLQSLINSRRPMPLLEKLNLIVQACNGLHYAHERNVVHRDIKPANLMVLKDGLVKIVDFGIARIGNENLTVPGQVVGTIHYMSPEQINGASVDCRTDIFATGVVLYQLLTYNLPFQGKDTGSTLLKIINEPPPPLQTYLQVYPPDLDHIVQRALAKSREDRYQTAEDFAFDLGQVQDQLKRELVSEYLKVAEDLIARSELTKAKEQVFQILKIDRQNRQASEMLREVQRLIQSRLRSEQVRQLRAEAEEAIAGQQLDRALRCLEQAVLIDPENRDLQQLCDNTREAKCRREKIDECIRRAESAQCTGELEEALAAVEEALSLNPNDNEARALHAAVQRDITERNRQIQIQDLVGEAQRQMSSRRFTAAIEVLHRAGSLDPSAASIRDLLALAENGREQERRRKEMEALTAEVQEALNRDDYELACAKAEEAIQRFPSDRALLKLQALAERQRLAGEKRKFIDEKISQARKLLEARETEQALHLLEAARNRFPTEAALLSLLTVVRENLERERIEARKTEYIQRAKDALRRKEYDEAAGILETARAELNAPEIDDLLQFVKDEAAANTRRRAVDAAAQEAHRLISEKQYQDAINFLKGVLQDVSDEELEILLADAQRQLEESDRRIADAIETAKRLLRVDRVTEALRFLESQTETCARSAEFQEMLELARREQRRVQVVSAAAEDARAALGDQNFEAALEIVEECRASVGDHPTLAHITAEILDRRREHAIRTVSKAITDSRMLLLGRSYQSAMELLDGVSRLMDWVPDDLRSRCVLLREEAQKGLQRVQAEQESVRLSTSVADRDDTEHQQVFNASTASNIVEFKRNRQRDIQELTELYRKSGQASIRGDLEAFSRRAGLIASHHSGDSEVETIASLVATTATTRVRQIEQQGTGGSQSPDPGPTIASLPESQNKADLVEMQGPAVSDIAPTADGATVMPDRDRVGVADEAIAGRTASPDRVTVPESPSRLPQRGTSSEPTLINRTAAQEPDARGVSVSDSAVLSSSTAPAPPSEILSGLTAEKDFGPVLVERKKARRRRPVLIAGMAVVALATIGLATWLSPRKRTADSATAIVVQTSPVGAVVRTEDGKKCVTPNCSLKLSPGSHKVMANLAGYAPEAVNVTIDRGNTPAPVSLTLRPLQSALRINGNFSRAKVRVDNREAGSLTDGQFTLDSLEDGDHNLTISGPDGEAQVSFKSASARPPVLSSPVRARDISVLVVSTMGGMMSIACNCTEPVELKVDGRDMGRVGAETRSLGDVGEGVHQLHLGSGDQIHSASVKLGQAPALDIFLNAERNAGTLIVETGIKDADVLINNKLARRAADGMVRMPMDAGHYTVRVQKKGYTASQPQNVEIRKNQESRLTFQLTPRDNKAYVAVRDGRPGARVSIDGNLVGTVDKDGGFYSPGLAPGKHSIQMDKEGYEALKFETSLKSGEIKNLSGEEVEMAKVVPPPSAGNKQVQEENHPAANPPQPSDSAQREWERVRNGSDARAFEAFIGKYPNSPYSADASRKLEQIDWDRVRGSNDPGQLQAFVSKHPDSLFAATARADIEKLNSARAEADRLKSDRNALLELVKEYASAYGRKDVNKIAELYPGLDKQQINTLRKAFKTAQSVRMELRPAGEPQINGNNATVTCQRSTQYTYPEGIQKPPDDSVTIQFKKNGNSWVVESIQ